MQYEKLACFLSCGHAWLHIHANGICGFIYMLTVAAYLPSLQLLAALLARFAATCQDSNSRSPLLSCHITASPPGRVGNALFSKGNGSGSVAEAREGGCVNFSGEEFACTLDLNTSVSTERAGAIKSSRLLWAGWGTFVQPLLV